MITFKDITITFGAQPIFSGISGSIIEGDRVGLVGPNGAGKTTFLKFLKGDLKADSGVLSKALGTQVGYLPQELPMHAGVTVYAELETVFAEGFALREELSKAYEALHTESERKISVLKAIDNLEAELSLWDLDSLPGKIGYVLNGLGFNQADQARPCKEFSGGWQMRIALAKLLVKRPELLMLDEPTNHLDLPSQRWLEKYLKSYKGAFILISHDRAFLDSLCTRTLVLEGGELRSYAGHYSFYEKAYAQELELREKAYEKQERSLEKTQLFIDRFRYKASKAKQVQSRIKALEKVDRIELAQKRKTVHFRFPKAQESGQRVLTLKNAGKAYGDFSVFQSRNLNIEKGDRIAIVGPNGAGKSTLVKILAGAEALSAGERELGYKVKVGYFAQKHLESLNPNETLLLTAETRLAGNTQFRVRDLLGAFLFDDHDCVKKVGVLSGGEKARLALACLLGTSANCLILDEPTNHLDMASKDVLQTALLGHGGTLVVVSHDRSFLDPLVNKVLEITPKAWRLFFGNVSEYLEKVENEETLHAQPTRKDSIDKEEASSIKLSAKEKRAKRAQERERLKPLKEEMAFIEASIESQEAQKDSLEKELEVASRTKGAQEILRLDSQYKNLLRKIAEGYARWEVVHQELESLQQEQES